MRDPNEIQRAIDILGTALASPELRRGVWGNYDAARERAFFCFSALLWAQGDDDTVFAGVLDHVFDKLRQYVIHDITRKKEEKENVIQ